jgi:hypothetical protein
MDRQADGAESISIEVSCLCKNGFWWRRPGRQRLFLSVAIHSGKNINDQFCADFA